MLMAGRIAPPASLSHARAPPFAPPSGLEGGMDVPSGGLGVVRRFAGKNGVARLVGCVGGARVESSLRGKEEGRCGLCGYGVITRSGLILRCTV